MDEQAHQGSELGDTSTGVVPDGGLPYADSLPALMFMVGVLVLFFTMMRWTRRSFKERAKKQPPPPDERLEIIRSEALQRKQEFGSVEADMQELVQRLAAVLDTKAARVEALLEEAEETIRRLDAAHTRTEAGAVLPPPVTPTGNQASFEALESPKLAIQRDELGPEARPDGVDPEHRRVYELSDEGLSVVEIAKRVGRPTGQVELILALRRGA